MEEEKPVEQGEKSGVDNNTEKDIAEKDDAKEESAEKADDKRESEEIDIYLFSNGQMYSPPRKYHLRADELQQWEATLGYLARKQYGSLHSNVELYELDGRKVEDPKSIRDCAVYVAVVPPDPFIYAGYDKYLVKASKSYEKRLSKRANGLALGETSSPDDIQYDDTNVSKLSQDFTPAPAPVKDNDLRPAYPSSRKNTEVRKSSVKNLNQKLDDKTKPISNQVSQSSNVPHILNLRSSDSVAKKISTNKREKPQNRSILNTTTGVLEKNPSINQSIDKGKSPYMPELYVCDHSTHRVNESLPALASNSNKINTNKQGSKLSMPTIRKTSNPININTKKTGDTFTITKKSLVDVGSTLKPNNVLGKDLPNQVTNSQVTARNKNPLLKTVNKSPSPGKIRILQPTKTPTIPYKKKVPPTRQITIITNTRASMVDISDLNSVEHTAVDEVTKIETFHDNKNRALAAPENKLMVVKEIPKSIDKIEGLETIQTRKLEPESSSINKQTTKYDEVIEQLNTKYKSVDADETYKSAYKNQVDKHIISLSDKLSRISEDQSIKTTETESLTNQIKVSTVEPVPVSQYIDTALIKGNKINNLRDTLQTNESQLNENEADASKTESLVCDTKVPMLYPVPEKTINHISNTGNGRAILTNKEFLSRDSNDDTTIKAVDADATKTHSFTFVIKKDDVHNTVKVTEIMANPKDSLELVKAPITSIMQDKDIVHINVYRNSLSESTPTKDNRARKQNNGKQYSEKVKQYKIDTRELEIDTSGKSSTTIENSNNVPLKAADVNAVVYEPPPSNNLIIDVMEPTTSQFVEFVQSEDIVNVKLSIQIKNSEGISKSTQKINMGKSNSDSHLDDDDTNQTANELTRSKSLQSVEDDAPHLCCRKDRVVVYQCACCTQTGGENTNYKLTANPTFPGQGIYVLLPVAMPIQNSIEAPCQKCDQQVQHAESFTKANFNISNKETLISVPGDGDKPTSIKLSNMSQNIKVNEKFIYDNPTKQQVAIQGQDVEQSRLIMMRTDPSQTSARYNMESKQQQTTTFSQDQFTQTDWCDVLLEARAEADGRYTFYLPPLHLLQQYTLR